MCDNHFYLCNIKCDIIVELIMLTAILLSRVKVFDQQNR